MNSIDFHFLGILLSGLTVGVIISIILLKITKTDKQVKCKYDERQELQRNKAFKYAFYTLMVALMAEGFMDIALETAWADMMIQVMTAILISVLVLVGYSIEHECYFSLNEDPKKILIVIAFIGITNIVIGVANIINGNMIENGLISWRIMNLLVGIELLIILVMTWIKSAKLRKEEQ